MFSRQCVTASTNSINKVFKASRSLCDVGEFDRM